jgi:molybdopterin synthase catalytic subunit
VFARVQNNDFSQQQLYDELAADSVLQGAGAIVTFTGLVRDFNAQGGFQGI